MTDFQRGFIALVKAALTEEPPAMPSAFSYAEAYELAEKQQLVPLVYYGALMDPAFAEDAEQMRFMARSAVFIGHSADQEETLGRLFAAFESEGLAYMPLKGTLLKGMYPSPEMRPMGDADILIRLDQYDRVTRLMEAHECFFLKESNHEYNWVSRTGLYLELHKRLIPSNNEDYYAYWGDGWLRARPIEEGACRYELSPEDLYTYLVTHYAKHFRDQGAGMKYILDFYIYRRRYPELDMAYVEGEMRKLHLWEFHEHLMHLLRVWFDGEASDEMADYLTSKVFDDGVFGNFDKGAVSEGLRISKSSKAVKRTERWRMWFPSYESMALRSPILRKWPILLPLMWVARWFDVFFHHKDRYRRRMARMEQMTDENIEQYRRELNYVGLDYHFDDDEDPPDGDVHQTADQTAGHS